MAANDLTTQIDSVASGPQSAESDGHKAVAQPLGALIQADRYNLAKNARGTRNRGIMFSKLLPAAGNPDQQGTNTANNDGDFDSAGLY